MEQRGLDMNAAKSLVKQIVTAGAALHLVFRETNLQLLCAARPVDVDGQCVLSFLVTHKDSVVISARDWSNASATPDALGLQACWRRVASHF